MSKKLGIEEFQAHSEKLVFVFQNQEAADHFKSWLCGSGEQAYWEWMRVREQEEDGQITGLRFNYHTGTDEILVQCGRLDDEK